MGVLNIVLQFIFNVLVRCLELNIFFENLMSKFRDYP